MNRLLWEHIKRERESDLGNMRVLASACAVDTWISWFECHSRMYLLVRGQPHMKSQHRRHEEAISLQLQHTADRKHVCWHTLQIRLSSYWARVSEISAAALPSSGRRTWLRTS